MIIFQMKTEENFAAFTDPDSGVMVFIDSFDNQNFDVRIGSLLESTAVGSVVADDSEVLNRELTNIYEKAMQSHANNTTTN